MWVYTKESLDKLTPKQALEFLKEDKIIIVGGLYNIETGNLTFF